MNFTCNSTLEETRIGSEKEIVGPLTFHELALIIAGASAVVAYVSSFYLIWRHALNYTKPTEQKHIIRILFMVPIYATSAFLCIWYYWNAVYYQVLSEAYEAFAIVSFFALMCHYIAPDLHEQKDFFRNMQPVKPWIWPLSWFAKCCGGERGPWRTPRSGLTWFNIVWIGVYHYAFIRVSMTITAVVTQHFERYCESSNSPVFAHIWVIAIESIAVTIAMYCIIQFYVQLREPLGEHKPFLKVLSIKLVIFLSFWQTIAISLGTSTFHLVNANAVLAYPDLKVGIPSLLLCFEMALFSILHLWAFPYAPYVPGAKKTYYPVPDPSSETVPRENERGPKVGGFAGLKALGDALNLWDVIKAFGRGLRWLFVGVKHRHKDSSYHDKIASAHSSYPMKPYGPGGNSTDHLPIANEFRRSTFGMQKTLADPAIPEEAGEESAGLIANAQSNPGATPASSIHQRHSSPYQDGSSDHAVPGPLGEIHPALRPDFTPYNDDRGDLGSGRPRYNGYEGGPHRETYGNNTTRGAGAGWQGQPPTQQRQYTGDAPPPLDADYSRRNHAQAQVGQALWGNGRDPQSQNPRDGLR